MRTENVSLPYPVLGISDDISPSLEETNCANPDITISEEGDLFKVSVVLKLDNKDILNYINEELAEYSVEVSCRSTMLRICKSAPTPEFNFTIEKKLVNDKLDFESFVIVKEEILNYKNEGLNPDYDGHTINLQKGDLLVAYNKNSFPLNLDLRNIRNMKSFITVQKNKNEYEHSVIYDLDSSKILILLPGEMMDEYNKKTANDNEKRNTILKSSLYLQALTYALLEYKKYMDLDKNLMWVNALTYRMSEPDIKDYSNEIIGDKSDSSDPNYVGLFKLAQMMLNQPYLGMLKQVSTIENQVGPILTDE